MEADAVKTGIEVTLAYSKNVTALSKPLLEVLHALHLDGLMKSTFDSQLIVIRVDDDETRIPSSRFFPPPHTQQVPCSPGEHKVSVAVGDFLGKLSIGEPMTRVELTVTVREGHLTQLRYEMGMAASTALSVTGERAV